MKNIVLVAQNNISVVMVENQYKVVQANNSKIALLINLKAILSGIPANDDLSAETRQVIIGSKSPIIGLVTGTWRQYVKTGVNGKGIAIPADELELWKDIANLYAQKCFNVQFTSDQFISKNDRTTKDLINSAWEAVKAEVRKANSMAPAPQQVAHAQANPVVVKLQALMAQALEEGDFDKYDKLEERLNKLQPQQTTETTAPILEEDPMAGAEDIDM